MLVAGCAKPISVKTIATPMKDVVLTVEIYNGIGPAVSDETRLYAHFSQNGATTSQLILSGDITISKITWTGPHRMNICVDGITDTFRNEVVLIDGRVDRKIYSSLIENC
jgi:hypothetical protein